MRHQRPAPWLSHGIWFAIVWLTVAWQVAHAAGPRRELWDLVPKDVGVALEARNLSDHSRRFVESELFRRIQRHPMWQQLLRGPQVQHFHEVRKVVNEVTQASLVSWLDKLFGQEVILSLTPQASGQPRFALLIRLKKPEDLAEILAAWDKLEPRTETRLQHRGLDYFRRIKANQQESLFYAAIDDVLVLADQAESIFPVLDLALDQQHEHALSRSPSFQKLLQTLNPQSVVRVVMQPSAWQVSRSISEEKPKDPVERWIHQAIGECQVIGLGIRLESGLLAEVIAMADGLERSPNWQKIVQKTAGAPAFVNRVPRTAVALIAGRHDFGGIAEWVLSSLSEVQVKQLKNVRQVLRGVLLGNDLFEDVLPAFPADFGAYVVPRADSQLTAIPVDGLLALALPSQPAVAEPGTNKPSIRQAVQSAVTTGVSFALALHNGNAQQEVTLETADFNGTLVHWIQNLGPIQPAYAVTTDYFVAASSPQLIRDFVSQSPANTLATDENFQKANAGVLGTSTQVALLRSGLVREFLTQHRGFLLKQLETAHKLKPDEASRRLDRMLEWVQLTDQLVVASSLHSDHIKVVLALNVFESRTAD